MKTLTESNEIEQLIQIIMDKQGNLIQVVDLELALIQVKAYMGYMNQDKESCEKQAFLDRQAYWADMYSKLMKLSTNTKSHGKD